MKTKQIILIAILLCSLLIRTISLDKIPSGINDDELHFVLNAKSTYYGFSDLEGKSNPFKLLELSSLIFSPIIGPLPSNLFTARLPYALIGTLSVLLIYLIIIRYTKNSHLALTSAFIAAFNPWSVYVSRTAFDAPVAICFYLLSIYYLSFPKLKTIIIAMIFGVIAFNAYIGTKILFFPIFFLTSVFLYDFHQRKSKKLYLIAATIPLLISLYFVITLTTQPIASRIQEIQSPYSNSIKDEVNKQRGQTVEPQLVKQLQINKYTVYLNNVIQKYIYNFSTDILFLSGDHASTGSLWKHGYFYYFDALLILFGIIYLYQNHLKFLLLLSTLIAISPIPEAIRSSTTPSFVFHSSLQFPFLVIITAAGLYFLWLKLNSPYLKISVAAIYFFSIINFTNIYFFRSPIYQPESFAFSNRILSRYLQLETTKNRPIYVLSQSPEVIFRSYLFYTNQLTPKTFGYIKKIYSISKDNITFNNIHFINHSKYLPSGQNFTIIYASNNFSFYEKEPKMYITNLSDIGKIYTIHNGSTCQNVSFSVYVNELNFKSLNVETIDENSFCKKYITI